MNGDIPVFFPIRYLDIAAGYPLDFLNRGQKPPPPASNRKDA